MILIFDEVFPMSPPLESHLQSEPFWTLKVNSMERFLDHVLLHASILNTKHCCTITLKDQWARMEVPSREQWSIWCLQSGVAI